MEVSNDARGWIMSGVSGVACVLGASVICIDLVVRKCFGRQDFEITNSNTFLSASMSLSSGVMLFSSLYSMLPTSKDYLTRAGLSAQASAWILVSLFLAGVGGIRIISVFIHRHIPSKVVDCAHSHDQGHQDPEAGDRQTEQDRNGKASQVPNTDSNGNTERTPLLQRQMPPKTKSTPAMVERDAEDQVAGSHFQKESLRLRWKRQLAQLVGGTKQYCDENGPCYGFSQKCGAECTKVIRRASTSEDAGHAPLPPQQDGQVPGGRFQTEIEPGTPQTVHHVADGWLTAPPDMQADARDADYFSSTRSMPPSRPDSRPPSSQSDSKSGHGHSGSTTPGKPQQEQHQQQQQSAGQHHHHVPQNAFLSIGLQTSLAISLHKLPEGFITYATNHASPTLGLTIFIALFIHNITEGFSMALPLYLALNSRWKAICWSSLMGGISQPAGAGLAALWIWGARKAGGGDDTTSGTSWGIYGGLFAATAGVMVSVALQLFSEGLGLTHNRNLCIGFAIVGMGVLGVSFALTA